MRQNIFETKQRAEELMQEALGIWQASDQSDFLTGLDKDPVFNVIMSALAYQANDLEGEIAQLKTDLLEEFEKTLSVGTSGNAVPATAVVRVNAATPTPIDISEKTSFFCQEANANFLPMLRSKAFCIKHYEVERLDGRRWRVGLDFAEPIGSLEGMTFAITEQPFHDLSVTLMDGDSEIPVDITAPWESHNMPMTEPFSLDTLVYNRTRTVLGGGEKGCISSYQRFCAMDLFAQQGLSLYYVGAQAEAMPRLSEARHIDLCFEFDGLGESFFFNEAQVAFNVVLLAQVAIKSVTLSKEAPVAKLAGGDEEDFLYLLRPEANQILSNAPIDVRRIGTDRFNRSDLIRLLCNLINRFQTDYYAFVESSSKAAEAYLQRIIESLKQLLAMASKDGTPGQSVYLQFNAETSLTSMSNLSLGVRYLVTKGDSINKSFSQQSKLTTTSVLDNSRIVQIVPPQYGHNAIRSEREEMALRRYMMTTNDRLVTPYDIKLFCYNELQVRYNIIRSMIEHIVIRHEPYVQGSFRSYVIKVTITLAANNFVQKAFSSVIPTVEKYLAKMIQVRTTGIYPVRVQLIIK